MLAPSADNFTYCQSSFHYRKCRAHSAQNAWYFIDQLLDALKESFISPTIHHDVPISGCELVLSSQQRGDCVKSGDSVQARQAQEGSLLLNLWHEGLKPTVCLTATIA